MGMKCSVEPQFMPNFMPHGVHSGLDLQIRIGMTPSSAGACSVVVTGRSRELVEYDRAQWRRRVGGGTAPSPLTPADRREPLWGRNRRGPLGPNGDPPLRSGSGREGPAKHAATQSQIASQQAVSG